jgi:hypothetical protein
MSIRSAVCLGGFFTCVLSGCAAVGDITGAVAGLAAGAASANPAVAIAVGLGVRAATREGVKYVTRRRHEDEQDAIAAAAADLRVGETQLWAVRSKIARDTRGEVRVLRAIETPLATCKEIAFSVSDSEVETAVGSWFTTIACREGTRWRWAAAEPAVERWGNLQ